MKQPRRAFGPKTSGGAKRKPSKSSFGKRRPTPLRGGIR